MIRLGTCAATLLIAFPALADTDRAIEEHILPGLEGFVEAAGALAESAAQDCRPEHVKPAYNAAFDAWMEIGDLRMGPSENAALSVAFWPDSKGFTPRALSSLIAAEDPAVDDADAFAEVSIAARGLFALDMLLYDPAFAEYDDGSYTCRLVQAVARDVSLQAEGLDEAWTNGFAEVLATGGASGNAVYLTEEEALRALYTQLLAGLEFTEDVRIGRPMGTFEQPRPTRAEAWRSGRSLRNVLLSVEAAQDLAHALADWELPATDAAVDRVRDAAAGIADPGFQDVTGPQARLRAEVLQQAVGGMRDAVEAEIGAPLGIAAGFNSQDGD